MSKNISKKYWDDQAIEEDWFSKVMNRGWATIPGHQQKMHDQQAAAIEDLNIISGKSVLDIGCGVGRLSKELLRMGATSLHGMDISTEMLDFAREECKDFSNVTWEPCDLTQGIPHEDDSFDVAFEWSVLLHILEDEDFESILGEMARVASKYVILGMDGPDTVQETAYYKRRSRKYHIQTLAKHGYHCVGMRNVTGNLVLTLFERA